MTIEKNKESLSLISVTDMEKRTFVHIFAMFITIKVFCFISVIQIHIILMPGSHSWAFIRVK